MSAIDEVLAKLPLERPQHAQRLREHILGHLLCMGEHTITGILSACGRQHEDWTADYRFYSEERVVPEALFGEVRQYLCKRDQGPVVVAMDETHIRKQGKKIFGVKFTRDPLSPPFHTNLITAQRCLQVSMAMCGQDGEARMVPVDWLHAPMPKKPGKKGDDQARAEYRQAAKAARIAQLGAQRLSHMRDWMDQHGASHRRLWAVVDGSFTNGPMFKALPHNTTVIGRIRSDAKLHYLPEEQPEKGRKRVYGERAPTPEELRKNDQYPWQDIEVFYAGKKRSLRAKRLGPLRWSAAGQHHDLQMVVIAPTPYQNTKDGKTYYRNPAYLICNDPHARIEDVVQYYLWRWDIEVNFRDEKTILGIGQAKVRTQKSVQNATALPVAAYALLLIAHDSCLRKDQNIHHLPAPKWQTKQPRRATTMNLIKNLRHEMWAQSLHFSDFVYQSPANTKPEKCPIDLKSAILHASTHS